MSKSSREEATAYEVTIPGLGYKTVSPAPCEVPGAVNVPVRGYTQETELGTGFVVTSRDKS